MPTHNCVGCGNCCDGEGWVVFTAERFRALAISLGQTVDMLADRSGFRRYAMNEHYSRHGRCPWVVDRKCAIHDRPRPDFCIAWPHIAGEDWLENARARDCQGVVEDGE